MAPANIMPKGFILIETIPEKEHEVYNRLLGVEEIVNIRPLFGEYDFLAEIYVKKFNELEKIVTKKIKALDGVFETRIRK
jgi:DNA-binding Lrp family transcriptional regulator